MLPFKVGTIAALAVGVPVNEFSVDTNGRVCPVGQVVRKANTVFGTTVILRDSAFAWAGIPHFPTRLNDLVLLAARVGPDVVLVSSARQAGNG